MSSNESQLSSLRPAHRASDVDLDLIAALRDGDEGAFETLILRHHSALIRLARVWIRDVPAAEEVVQETWLAVVQGIHAFQGRSRLQSWIFGILANKAKRRGIRESRSHPFSTVRIDRDGGTSPAMDPDSFFPAGHEWAGHWIHPVPDREGSPDRYILADEMGDVILRKIDELPAGFRGVILLRDLHGFSANETCTLLGITASNQRVILHRARTRLRISLEPYLNGGKYASQDE